MIVAGVDARGRDLAQRNARSGGGGGGGGGGEQPSPLFVLGGALLMGTLGGLAFGIFAAVQVISADASIGFIVSGACFGALLLLLAYVFQNRIFQWFDDPQSTRAQTAPVNVLASAADAPSLPLVVVSL